MKESYCIGTRGSQLALWQANFIKSQINKYFADIDVTLNIIKTKGDRITDRPLSMVGGKGLFVKEIETALLNNEIDLAVHSMKDMPGELPPGLTIGAIPKRENPFDVLIAKDHRQLADYPENAVIGTSSLRRASQIKNTRPDLHVKTIRGNLDTRIKKLKSGEFDAIILAAAGLIRMEQTHEISQYLEEHTMLPAVGQGALCIETRVNDDDILPILKKLDHDETRVCVEGERAFLKQIEGSCHIPVACYGKIKDDQVILTGLVASEDGQQLIKEQITSPVKDVDRFGRQLADTLLEKGGAKILEALDKNA